MNEIFNKNAKVEKFNNMLGKANRYRSFTRIRIVGVPSFVEGAPIAV